MVAVVRRLGACLGVIWVAAACTTEAYWVPTPAAVDQLDLALQKCEQAIIRSPDPKHRIAARGGRSEVYIGGPGEPFAFERLLRKCMLGLGWERHLLTDRQAEQLSAAIARSNERLQGPQLVSPRGAPVVYGPHPPEVPAGPAPPDPEP